MKGSRNKVWLVVALALATAFLINGGLLSRSVSASGGASSVSHADEAQEFSQALPNGLIAFVSNRGKGSVFLSDLYTMKADGSEVRRIVDTGFGTAFYPTWSPDGGKIAVALSLNSGAQQGIHTVNSDGSGLRQLTTDANDSFPSWSPDGSKIAFVRIFQSGIKDLFVVNSDGTNLTNITSKQTAGEDILSPRWSPDGSRIAYIVISLSLRATELFLINPDGTNNTRLTFGDKADVLGLDWSPDSSKIVYITRERDEKINPDGNTMVIINRDGGGRIFIPGTQVNADGFPGYPSWSPDGTRIVFSRAEDIGSPTTGTGEIYVMNTDGSNQQNITNTAGSVLELYPDWGVPGTPPQGPDVKFSSPTYNVNEGGLSAAISVAREGDISGTTTVDYVISDGTAQQRTDYTLTSGTLRFAPGETSKTFNIPLTDDNYVEGNESLNLNLSTPTGGDLRSPSAATLLILDNDTTPTANNPIDDAQLFVRQHYYDFLSRLPDQGGLGYWTDEITRCGTDQACINSRRVGVSAAYFAEPEFQQTGFFVYRLYKASYGQRPSYAQFMPDRSRIVASADLELSRQQFTAQWVQRPAFTAKYPLSLSGTAFIEALIATLREGSAVDLSGRNGELLAEYNAGSSQTDSRARALRKLIEYQEFTQAEYNPAFVLMEYFGYLRRDPDEGGYQFWLDILNNRVPGNYKSMVCAFITSPEYQQRFSSSVTRSDQVCGSIGQ